MDLNLDRDLVFFDIESTGLNVITDRIIQIALIKYKKDGGEPEEMELLINPGSVMITKEAMNVHGITPDKIRNKPTFDQVAEKIYNFIGDADLAGYNSDRFDIPMLMEELHRCGYDLDIESRRCIDVQKIFYKMEPRTLQAAVRYFCNKELDNAHDALADVRATVDVLQGQLKKYDGVDYVDGDGFRIEAPIKNDVQALSEFTNIDNVIDVTMRLKYDKDGEVVFNFGKYKGQKVKDVFKNDKNYSSWILDKDFSVQVKKAVRRLLKEIESELS